MSDLPQYSRVPNAETGERDSLIKAGRSSLDESAPSYPPRAGASSATTYSNVTYTFAPRYPVKGNTQNVLGVLGRDRDVSHFVSGLLSWPLGQLADLVGNHRYRPKGIPPAPGIRR
jgi:hypothetical protein